ncbi:MAG: endonuclease/exonuclease/phosphatase family protein [Bacteroidales bacterium]|nr:endonuclease/exonuclease/phosphatase family protein [Bacteroidales bacterium]
MANKKNIKKKTSFVSYIFLVLNIVVVILLLSCYAVPYIRPDKFWPVVFLGFAYPAILLINILFVIFWLLKLKVWLVISFIAILAGWNQVRAYINYTSDKETTEQTNSIRVMTFNVRYFDRYRWVNTENVQTRNQIFEMIDNESPDLICFQEFYSDLTPDFNTTDSLAIAHDLRYFHTAFALVKSKGRSYGIATFSRYPIVNRDSHNFTNNIYNFAVITDIVVEADTFRVFNIHFESIRLSEEDRLFINDLSRQVDTQEETVAKYRQIFSKIRFASSLRATQSKEIRTLVENSPYPVIICTDLNDTPSSYAYNQLTRNLKDAFVESGNGLGNTYIGFLPAFRIDYILYDPFFKSHSYRKIPDKLSDHYPVVTNLAY